jgi:hypothetical protein
MYMKALYVLLLCFGLLPGFSTIHATGSFSEHDINTDEPKEKFYSTERLKYYKNGNLKRRQTVFYTMDGKEYQTIDEKFRKSGAKRNCWVMNPRNVIQLTRYNSKGLMKFERNYYYSGAFLQSVETRRANGKIRVQYQPEAEPPTRYVSYFLKQ